MGEAFAGMFSQFKEMERAFERSQSVVARSGKLIESLCRMKRRSKEAKELFTIFSELAEGRESAKLTSILDSVSSEMRLQGAKIMRRLGQLSEAKIPGAEHATTTITQLAAKYEESLLREFHDAFEKNELPLMRLCASLLIKYNGGHSCIQSFVGQHAFFTEPIDTSLIKTAFAPGAAVSVDVANAPTADPLLLGLYGQIAQTAEADWTYLEAVFEEPVSVMNYLVQKIFQEPVHLHIEEILRQAQSHSHLAYLRTLQATHQATLRLVERMNVSYSKHIREAATRSRSSTSSADETIAGVEMHLNALTADLFAPHLTASTYLDLERQVANELYSLLLLTVMNQPKRSKNVLSAVFSRHTGGNSVPASPRPPSGDEQSLQPLFFFNGEPLIDMTAGPAAVPSEEAVRKCLVLHHGEALRLFSLLSVDRRGEALLGSLKTLFSYIVEKHVEASLETAIEAHDSNSRPFDINSFVVIHASTKILGSLLVYCQTQLLPLLVTASPIVYRDSVTFKSASAARVSEKIERLLRREFETSLRWIEESLLGKQKKADFKPKPDDLEVLGGASQACKATCDYVRQLAKVVQSHLDQANSARFLAELGSALFDILLSHIKGYIISDAGAMVLQNDLRQYKEAIASMGEAGHLLRERYEMLWELGHLYLVRPENLRSVLSEGHLGRIDAKLIYPYISQRADFSSAHIDQVFPDMEKSFSRLFL